MERSIWLIRGLSTDATNQPAHQLVGWLRDTLFSGQDMFFTSVMFEIIMESFLSVFWDTVTDRNALRWLRDAENMAVSPKLSFLFFVNCKKKKKKKLACFGEKNENLHVGALK